MKTCVDLFCGLGGFSEAFRDSPEWDVFTVDIEERFAPDLCADVMDLRPGDLPNADVVLASPPCTVFSTVGNHDKWDDKRPAHPDARDAIALVFHTVGLIRAIDPEYWFLENPRGRLRWVLGKPTGHVNYCQYGKDYKKPTDLWGEHPPWFAYLTCNAEPGSGCHVRNGANDGTSGTASMPRDPAKRALVPRELSESVLQAVSREYETATVTGWSE